MTQSRGQLSRRHSVLAVVTVAPGLMASQLMSPLRVMYISRLSLILARLSLILV